MHALPPHSNAECYGSSPKSLPLFVPRLLQGTVHLYAACARASPWLWLTPYAGHRAAEAVDAFIAAGWDSAEVRLVCSRGELRCPVKLCYPVDCV